MTDADTVREALNDYHGRRVAALAALDRLVAERDEARARAVELETEEISHRLSIRDRDMEALVAERDGWKRHANTSDREVQNLRVGFAAVMESLALPPMMPQMMWQDGAMSIMRRTNEIVDEANRLALERDRLREALTLTLSRIGHQTWCACDICQPAREALGSGV